MKRSTTSSGDIGASSDTKRSHSALPSWVGSMETPSIDDVPLEIRLKGEQIVVTEIMGIVQNARHNTVYDVADSNRKEVLTQYEQDVFSRFTYYGFKYGIPAGIATFTILYGGLRYVAYRNFLKEINLPNAPNYHAQVAARKQHFQLLDRPKLNTTTIKTPSTRDSNATQMTSSSSLPPPILNTKTATPTISFTSSKTANSYNFAIFPDDVTVTLQLYVTAAIGLFVSVMTWHQMFDWPRLHRDVSNLPLQSGPSVLCQELCNKLIQYRTHIENDNVHIPVVMLHDTEQNTPSSILSETTTVTPTETKPKLKILQLNAKELWEDPVSENLEHMVHMVCHCEQRMQFEKECELRNYRLVVQPSDERTPRRALVDVPETGVPIRYHKLNNSSSGSGSCSSMNHHDNDNHSST
jgi:hypothetical protein